MNDIQRCTYSPLVRADFHSHSSKAVRTETASAFLVLRSLHSSVGLMKSNFPRSSAHLKEPSKGHHQDKEGAGVVLLVAWFPVHPLGCIQGNLRAQTPAPHVWSVLRSLGAGHLPSEPYFLSALEQSLILD